MKKIMLTLSILSLTSGLALAASTTYEGFPVVNVAVNGLTVQSDVPAINLNGRTMVPLRMVSEKLGADVSWEETTSTAVVKTKTSDQLKGKVIEMDVYLQLHLLGLELNEFNIDQNTDKGETPVLQQKATSHKSNVERIAKKLNNIEDDNQFTISQADFIIQRYEQAVKLQQLAVNDFRDGSEQLAGSRAMQARGIIDEALLSASKRYEAVFEEITGK